MRARTSVVETTTQTLRRSILDGSIAPGERLPSERDLSQKFRVTRTTVRSALERLAGEGLVSVRHGSGYTVRNFLETGAAALLPVLVENASPERRYAIGRDVLRVKRAFARAFFEAVEYTASEQAQARIAGAIDHFAKLVDDGASAEALAHADAAISAALVEATGSDVFALVFNPLALGLAQFPTLREVIYSRPSYTVHAQRALLAWISSPERSPDLVELFMREIEARDRETLRLFAVRLGLVSEPGSDESEPLR